MKIGIIGAMDEELIPIRALIHGTQEIQKGGRTFWSGQAAGHVLYLTRCDPGKVNASIATQQMIDHFQVDVIFNMGSSGALAPELEVGDLIVASETIQHDFDITSWGLKPGELIFDAHTGENGRLHFRSQQVFAPHPRLTQMALDIARTLVLADLNGYTPKVRLGRILSGDQFIHRREKADELHRTLDGLCADMEAAAIAHTCEANRIPFLCIRAISDKADHSAMVSFTDFLVAATANYGHIFEALIQKLDGA